MAWKADYHLPGTETLKLHHLYRAMAWLGEPLGDEEQDGAPAAHSASAWP